MITLSYAQKEELGTFLEQLAKSIDLSETQNQEAADRYGAVAEFLSDPSGSLARYNPKIVPQGSMRIGTTTRPVIEDDEFDVDATCRVAVALPSTQAFVKKIVGDRFSESEIYNKMLNEKKRCWSLRYHENAKFHMDVVPSVPDEFKWLLGLGVPYKYAEHAIKITDNTDPHYHTYSSDFPRSNPEGYALWFLDVMKIQADQIRMKLAAELRMSADRIPEYKVRTPLQRSIQLMKRHRDIMFGKNKLKPISIIITTLAGRSYADVMRTDNSSMFYDIIVSIVERMPLYIESRQGIKWIPNPVNPNENFADKWATDKRLEDNFNKWHRTFLSTLKNEKLTESYATKTDFLRLSFGSRAVNDALNSSSTYNEAQRLEGLKKTASVISSGNAFTDPYGHIGSSGVKNEEHRFHYKNSVRIPRKRDFKYAYLSFQKNLVEEHYSFLKCKIEKNVLKCRGWIQPEYCKDAYEVLIEYVVGHEPKTTILSPDITPSSEIHMYRDHSLCLHYPPDMKWNERTRVYQYTVPWISEWIIYYELYLLNGGKWEGKESPAHLTEATKNINEDLDG